MFYLLSKGSERRECMTPRERISVTFNSIQQIGSKVTKCSGSRCLQSCGQTSH